jgi:hypothetical protein
MMGAGALAAGGAMAAGVGYVLKPAIAMQAEMKRVQEAVNDGADTMSTSRQRRRKRKSCRLKA